MMRFSKKVEYALIALLHIAKKNNGELTTARELSDKFDISLELMGKILQSLVKSRLIISVQGVKGGYYLAQLMNQIKIYSVITAIDGPIAMTDCIASGDPEICDRGKNCLIRKSMEGIQAKLVKLLDEISLNDFEKTYSRTANK
ncbi:MAG TPA: Rrf2 family transcriptional regulator [bacterium]